MSNDDIIHYNPPTDNLSAPEIGRNRLAEWQDAQPDNYFTADKDLQRKLELYMGVEAYRRLAPELYQFGRTAAQEIDPLVRVTNQDAHLPRLDRYDAIGRRTENVTYHPHHHAAGRLIYGSGVMAKLGEMGSYKQSLAFFYLSAQNGEAGHNCPLACTAGVIKTLQHVAPASLRDRFLPRLLDPDYDQNYTGAQFFTEVQGGSDVGLNAVRATPQDTDSEIWYLNGEKWFCSHITADLALVTARTGAESGTRGLSLFLVPRLLTNGRPNGIYINRLKEKMGTRSLATAEIEFRDARAYKVGTFKDGMMHVINTSRVFNAFACAGNARRALTTAWTYAHDRLAFGQPLIRYPIIQEQIARMNADTAAMLAGSMRIAKVLDEIETGKADEDDKLFLRMAVNLNKYRTAVLAHEVINTAIEILGGNGTIESFSVLPRLLRDNVVYENWEGPHNTLLAQVQRDVRRYEVHRPFLAAVRELLSACTMEELQKEGRHQLDRIEGELDQVLEMDELTGAIYFRPLMDQLSSLYYVACMAAESGWERREKEDKTKQRLAIFHLNHRVNGRGPGEITYYDDQVSRLSSSI